ERGIEMSAKALCQSQLKIDVAKLKYHPEKDISSLAACILSNWLSRLSDKDKTEIRSWRKKSKSKRKRPPPSKKKTILESAPKLPESSQSSLENSERVPELSGKVLEYSSTPIDRVKRRRIGGKRTKPQTTVSRSKPSLTPLEAKLMIAPSQSLLSCPLCWRSNKVYKGDKGLRSHLVESQNHQNLTKEQIRTALLTALAKADSKLKSSRNDDTRKLSVLAEAAKRGDLDQIRRKFSESSEEVRLEGIQLLSWSASSGNVELVKFLVETVGVDPFQISKQPVSKSRFGRTPLHWAARHGRLRVVQYLLEKGRGGEKDAEKKKENELVRRVDTQTNDGTTALHLACYGGFLDVAKYLVSKGANPHVSNSYGCTSAHWVAMGGDVQLARWLRTLEV
ncbi:hypothetical protein AAMO2058_001638800, partial [Amorphochlora amoebiformis]